MFELLAGFWDFIVSQMPLLPLLAVTPVVPAPQRVAEKWARRAAGATQDYTDGVRAASGRWQPAAAAAKENYKTGVTAAAGRGAYEKGVAKATDAKWQRKAADVGSQRFGPGAAAAQPDFAQGIGPVLETIGRTDIPPRGPRGNAGNYSRVQRIGEALNKLRTGS